MIQFPAVESFSKHYGENRPQVVWTELVADLETPVSAMLKLAAGQPYSFLLESVEGGAVRGRYSVLGFAPDLIWRCTGAQAEIARVADGQQGDFVGCEETSLDALSSLIAQSQIDLPDAVPPSAVGVFGYMSYDMVRLMERLPDANPDVIGIPDAVFIRPTVTAVFDNVADKITVVTPVWPDPEIDAETAYVAAGARLDAVIAGLDRSVSGGLLASSEMPDLAAPVSNTTREAYHSMVERAKAYIRAGDIFQVVPSQRFSLPLNAPPMALYRALRRLNPSPFLFIVNMDGFSLVGSSPEILVRLRDDTVTVRPIAGTRPRGATAAEDEALAAELLADPKEQAEHLMLLDLGRNDVGRVAEIGTVEVTESYTIERYSHVMHIVSNVQGQIKSSLNALQALVAGFPAGTVSGAPKIRAMEIIDELETERRSFYAGTVGYFGANGDMDTCITLRTALVRNGTMYVQAGGGVVADSDPEAEYQESNNKAKALLRAAAEAQRYANISG
ncbi:MAG: anthranilate synthase component I [Alphaproteobacteria bacterium]|nr:anthranilate synthase component I [Alphaproteobacteria bacterium]